MQCITMHYDPPSSALHYNALCIMMHFVLWCTLYHYALCIIMHCDTVEKSQVLLCITTMHCLWVSRANDIFILKALPPKSIALSLPFIFCNQIHHLYLSPANWQDWKLWQHINLDLLQIIWIFWDRFWFKDQHFVFWQLLYQLSWPVSF